MDSSFLGVDISKQKFDVALLEDEKPRSKVYSNDLNGFNQLVDWLKSRGVTPHICLEATSYYGHALANHLYALGYRVSMVNPARIKGFSKSELSRTKTDKADAKMIARFCMAMRPSVWIPEEKWQVELKQWNAYSDDLKKMVRMEKNRIAGVCSDVAKSMQKHVNYLEKEIKKTQLEINNLIEQEPELANRKLLLESIPGIGDVTTAHLIAFIGDPERFESAKQITAYAGLNPRHKQSGTSIKGHTSISKTGHGQLRKSLYMPALVAIRYNPKMQDFYLRLVKNGKAKKAAITAVMRKLLVICYTILKNKTPYRESADLGAIMA